MVELHFSLMVILFLVTDQEVSQEISLDYIILDNWIFDNIISVDDLPAKALRILATCLLANNNLWGKLVSASELPTIFDDSLQTTSASFFIADFNLLSYDIDSFNFKD